MYRRCHVCARSFGTNRVVPQMTIGTRLAFDPERGRLWVVCGRCGEWNLTGLEERWEAVEECERQFAAAVVRASSQHVGLAKIRGLELLRVGASTHRDEMANWRYGGRLRRRRRRASILVSSAGVVAGGTVGGAVLAAASVSSLAVAGIGVVIAGVWAHEVLAGLGKTRGTSFLGPTGVRLRLSGPEIDAIRLTRTSGAKGIRTVGALAGPPGAQVRYGRHVLLQLLSAVLPRLNWHGATAEDLRAATRLVDAEEKVVADASRRGGKPIPAWQRVALANWPADDLLRLMKPVARLAFEMAVTEEIERQALAGEAGALESRWRDAEEIAGIADSMFVPAFVTEWLARHRREPKAAPDGEQA